MPSAVDELDAQIIELLDREPKVGILEASRRLGVARGTVQARLDRLVARGVIASFAPTVSPAALGFTVTAFVNLEIRQGARDGLTAHLRTIAEVLEAHTITGQGDLLCRLVARDNDDLQRVIDLLVADADVLRSSTVMALACVLERRTLPLVRQAAAGRPSRSGPG